MFQILLHGEKEAEIKLALQKDAGKLSLLFATARGDLLGLVFTYFPSMRSLSAHLVVP